MKELSGPVVEGAGLCGDWDGASEPVVIRVRDRSWFFNPTDNKTIIVKLNAQPDAYRVSRSMVHRCLLR